MAVDKFGSDILKSFYGRQFGLDKLGFLTGHVGAREPQETLTAASTMDNKGTTVLTGTTATFTLAAPLVKGVLKEIINASTISTAAMAIVRSTALGACSFLPLTSGTTAAGGVDDVKRINLINVGAAVRLRSISTSQWAVCDRAGSSLYFTISTSS
jgi:hypothetical protein